jgi:hypothetical protein
VGAGGRSKKFKTVVPMAAERQNFAKRRKNGSRIVGDISMA